MAEPEPGTASDHGRVSTSGAPAESGASGVRVRIDQDKCTGDGLCVTYAPDVFEFDIDGLAYVKSDDGTLLTDPGASTAVPDHLRVAVIDSADECPGDCIYVRHDDGTVIAGPE
jgi:ferredoxin